MRVLHLSHNGLPDTRVERSALTGKRNGYVTAFAGPFINDFNILNSFDKDFKIPFNRYANIKIPYYWGILKKSFSKVLKEFKPDIIHAHNIVAGKVANEYEIPFIYDDHEYWSKQAELRLGFWRPQRRFIKWLYLRWEKEILTKAPVITVSETIAEEHRKINSHVYVTPNFPSRVETEAIRLNIRGEPLSSIYTGLADFSNAEKGIVIPHRNVKGVTDIFNRGHVGNLTVIGDPKLSSSQNVFSLGVMSHQKLMTELAKHHIGLMAWKKHSYHKYCNPNKPYDYAHAGLLTVLGSDLPIVKSNLKEYSITFNDFGGLEELLIYYADNVEEINKIRDEIRAFALKNLLWEKRCDTQILKAYSKT